MCHDRPAWKRRPAPLGSGRRMMGPLTVGRWFVLCSLTSTTARSSPVLANCCSSDQAVSCSAGSRLQGQGQTGSRSAVADLLDAGGVVLPTVCSWAHHLQEARGGSGWWLPGRLGWPGQGGLACQNDQVRGSRDRDSALRWAGRRGQRLVCRRRLRHLRSRAPWVFPWYPGRPDCVMRVLWHVDRGARGRRGGAVRVVRGIEHA